MLVSKIQYVNPIKVFISNSKGPFIIRSHQMFKEATTNTGWTRIRWDGPIEESEQDETKSDEVETNKVIHSIGCKTVFLIKNLLHL